MGSYSPLQGIFLTQGLSLQADYLPSEPLGNFLTSGMVASVFQISLPLSLLLFPSWFLSVLCVFALHLKWCSWLNFPNSIGLLDRPPSLQLIYWTCGSFSSVVFLGQDFARMCVLDKDLPKCSSVFCHMDTSTRVLHIFFATPQARFFYVLGSFGLQGDHGAVPSVTGRWWVTGRLFVSQSPFAVSALGPAVLLLWGLGERWGRSSYVVWGMDRWESMVLWRISSSQETKLSHLCPGALWALSPGPARPPVVRVSNLTSRSCLCTVPATGLTRGGWIGFGRKKVFRVGLSRMHLQTTVILLYIYENKSL